jgi:hypothetical protein
MSKEEMIQRLFATSNRDNLVTYLEAVKGMYAAQQPVEKAAFLTLSG